jgi:hypothetical protein
MELNNESGRHPEENGDDLQLAKGQASGDIWGNNGRRNIRKIGHEIKDWSRAYKIE